MSLIQDMNTVREAVLAYYRSDAALAGLSGTSRIHLDTVISAIQDPLPLNTGHQAASVPATRYWPRLMEDVAPPFQELCTAANAIFDHLHWKINKNYIGIFPSRFFDNEAFVEMIGPNGLLLCDEVRVGFLILGEDIYYPSHHHEATELYHPVSGTGLWQQGEGDEVSKPPATPIYHEEWENHAMRTTNPCLNLWSWAGEIGQEAQAS